jgi:hypothetical protein
MTQYPNTAHLKARLIVQQVVYIICGRMLHDCSVLDRGGCIHQLKAFLRGQVFHRYSPKGSQICTPSIRSTWWSMAWVVPSCIPPMCSHPHASPLSRSLLTTTSSSGGPPRHVGGLPRVLRPSEGHRKGVPEGHRRPPEIPGEAVFQACHIKPNSRYNCLALYCFPAGGGRSEGTDGRNCNLLMIYAI